MISYGSNERIDYDFALYSSKDYRLTQIGKEIERDFEPALDPKLQE